MITRVSLVDREHDHAVVLQDQPAGRPQLPRERYVMIKPPERRPADDEIPDPAGPLPAQFAERVVVARRRAPVLSVPPREGDGLAAGHDRDVTPVRPLSLVG